MDQIQMQEGMKKRNKLGLTPTQKKVYDAIVEFIDANNYSPSYEELKQILGYTSKSPIHGFIHQLKRRKWIASQKGASRSIIIL